MKRLAILFLALVLCASAALSQDLLNKGKVALGARDTTTAVQAFKDAVKANQKPSDANYYLGLIAFHQRKLDDAQAFLDASLKADDENADAMALLADLHALRKNFTVAAATYKRALKLAPKSPRVIAGYGLTLLAADSIDGAIAQLTRAKDVAPDNPEVFAGLGEAYLKQNVPPLAVMNLQKAIELAPKNYTYRYRLGQIYEKTRQYNEAIAQYDTLVALDSSNVDALLNLGQILVRASGNQKRLAIAPLLKYVGLRPKSVEGNVLLVKAYFLTNNFDETVKGAKKALDLDPKNGELWREYAYSLVELKDFKTALTAFDELKRLKAFKPEDQMKLGTALFGVGRDDEAMTNLLEAVKLDSSDCDPYFALGSLYMKKQDYTSATKYFEKRIACDPRSLSSYLNAAACYMQLKDWPRTRQLLDTALVLKPDFLQARLWLARYFLQVDSSDRAKQQYDEVLNLIGNNTDKYKRELGEAHSMTGSYYFSKERYPAAIESFRRAISYGYDNAGLHLSWGQAILQTLDPKEPDADGQKKKEDAIKQFRRAVEMEQGNASAHFWLGQGLIIIRVPGDDAKNKQLKEEACSEFKKVLRLQPTHADAKKAVERYGCN